jgi:cell division protein FtsX
MRYLQGWQQELFKPVPISILLKPETPLKQQHALQATIQAWPYVEHVDLWPSAQAASTQLPVSEDIFSTPMPVLEVAITPTASWQSVLSEIRERAHSIPDILKVDAFAFNASALQVLNARLIQALYLIQCLLWLPIIALLFQTHVYKLHRHREDIALLHLMGASPHWLFAPFLLDAIFSGLLAAGFASAILFLSLQHLPATWLSVPLSDKIHLVFCTLFGGLTAGLLAGLAACSRFWLWDPQS